VIERATNKEPWHRGEEHETKIEILDAGGKLVCTVDGDLFDRAGRMAANAERILGCVNEREGMLALLREIEWTADHDEEPGFCPVCHSEPAHTHTPDCRLAAFLMR
jgi:hypothetical protein